MPTLCFTWAAVLTDIVIAADFFALQISKLNLLLSSFGCNTIADAFKLSTNSVNVQFWHCILSMFEIQVCNTFFTPFYKYSAIR